MYPPISSGDEPPFYKLDEYRFQKLCQDLHAHEPGIASATVYGARGESQQGIDVRALRLGLGEIEVGQCKRYETFSPANIRAVSEEFFAYWPYWQTQQVKRFILFVTADLSSRAQIAALDEERERFRLKGINYESWDSGMIRNKLRNHPGIVATYVDEPNYWVQKICGTTSPGSWRNPTTTQKISSDYQKEQIEALAKSWSDEVTRRIEEIREAWREGQKDSARLWLYQIKSDQIVWQHIAPHVKANVLRFEAHVMLDLNREKSTYEATRLISEAHSLVPDDSDLPIRAIIAYYEQNIEQALQLVANISQKTEHANLQAAILLETNRLPEAKSILEQARSTFSPDANTFRIHALLHLVMGKVDQAQQMIKQAQALAPSWEAVRQTHALLNYYSVVSPALLPDVIPQVPEPIEWAFVKQDDTSLLHLRNAAEVFGELAETAHNSTIRYHHLVWRMATLSLDPDAQAEAAALCQKLLKEMPSNGLIFQWALIREYPVDFETNEKSLERRLRKKDVSLQEVLILLQYYLAQSKIPRAISLLKRTSSLFQQHQELWETKYLQLRILKGEHKAISSVLTPPGEALINLELKTLALRIQAEQSGNWQSLRDHLADSIVVSGTKRYIFELCRLLATQFQWDDLAKWADQLVTAIDTPEAIRLAAIGLFNSHQYPSCLSLLDTRQSAFRANNLPQGLKQIRTHCLLRLGRLSEALNQATHLVQEAATTENLLILIDIYLVQGDLVQVAVVARELRNRLDLPVEQALRLATLIRSEDLPLAREFWHQGTRNPLADDMVGTAYSLGMQLGLDSELRELTTRLVELGASGREGFKAVTISDLLEFAQQRHEHHAELKKLYYHGDVPIHVIAESLNIPLIDLYHRNLAFNETAQRPQIFNPLLTRHGSRPPVPTHTEYSKTHWRLNLDITALLLAAHLDILDQIEETFSPLRIPKGLMPALLTIRNQLPHHQPSRLSAAQCIVTLVKQGRLQVLNNSVKDIPLDVNLIEELGESWAALHALARRKGGYLVDFLPLTKRGLENTPVVLPEDAKQYVTNCYAVIQSLKQYGRISETKHTAALGNLGEAGQYIADAPIPIQGKTLFCYANILEMFFNAGVLDTVAAHFRVFIEQDEYEQANGALHYNQQQQGAIDWIDNLIDRVRQGLQTGVYQRIAETVIEQDNPEGHHSGFLTRCLTSLFECPVQEGDLIWIDDRFVNAYIHRDTVPIIDTVDVIRLTAYVGALTRDQHYNLLSQLRAADVRFIPVDCDEIIFALTRANIDEGGHILETSHIINLRRYIARCLLQGDILQWPPLAERKPPYPNADGEIAFVANLQHAIDDALITIWSTETDLTICRARATWLVHNLMFDPLMARTMAGLLSADANKHLSLASHLAGLIVRGWSITRNTPDATDQARKAYHEWLELTLINPKIAVEPLLVSAITNILKEILDNLPEDLPTQMIESFLRRQLEWVPTVVADQMVQDQTFMARFSIKFHSVVSCADRLFDADVFWSALEIAVNGESTVAHSLNSQEALYFESSISNTDSVVIIAHPITHQKYKLNDPALRLLTRIPSLREEILRQNRYWFDCSEETFEQVLAEIMFHSEPRQCVEIVESWRNKNTAVYYALLEQSLYSKQTFQLEDLRTASAESLLYHFRLMQPRETKPLVEMLKHTATVLLRETGIEETIDRLMRIPVPLSDSIFEAFMALSAEAQRNLIKQLLPLSNSPLSVSHLLRLLTLPNPQIPAFHRLARRLTSHLIDTFNDGTITAYLALLVWVHELFDAWNEMEAWAPETRMAMVWAHTDKIFRIFIHAGTNPNWIIQTFGGGQSNFIRELLHHNRHAWQDMAHPRYQDPFRFLIASLCYGLNTSIETIINDRIREQLIEYAFPIIDGIKVPSAALFGNPSRSSNLLHTFLGYISTEQIEQVLGSEEAGNFIHSEIRLLTETSLKHIQNSPDDVMAWSLLKIVLAGQMPDESLRKQILTLLSQIDFVALYRLDPESSTHILQTVAQIAFVLHDPDTGEHLVAQLEPIAQVLAKSQDLGIVSIMEGETDKSDYYVRQLLETCIYFVIAAYPDEETGSVYSRIIHQIVDTHPLASTICRPFIENLCRILPITEAQHFWPLLARLRTE